MGEIYPTRPMLDIRNPSFEEIANHGVLPKPLKRHSPSRFGDFGGKTSQRTLCEYVAPLGSIDNVHGLVGIALGDMEGNMLLPYGDPLKEWNQFLSLDEDMPPMTRVSNAFSGCEIQMFPPESSYAFLVNKVNSSKSLDAEARNMLILFLRHFWGNGKLDNVHIPRLLWCRSKALSGGGRGYTMSMVRESGEPVIAIAYRDHQRTFDRIFSALVRIQIEGAKAYQLYRNPAFKAELVCHGQQEFLNERDLYPDPLRIYGMRRIMPKGMEYLPEDGKVGRFGYRQFARRVSKRITPFMTYVHNDLHLENVLATNKSICILDWNKLTYGLPFSDVILLVEHFRSTSHSDREFLYNIREQLYAMYAKHFAKAYLELVPSFSITEESLAEQIQSACLAFSPLVNMAYAFRNSAKMVDPDPQAWEFYKAHFQDSRDFVLEDVDRRFPEIIKSFFRTLRRRPVYKYLHEGN